MLDLTTGELTARSDDRREGTAGSYDEQSDTWERWWEWDRSPRRIAWSTGYWEYEAKDVNLLLGWLQPWAQRLADALTPLPGPWAYDWTVEAAQIERMFASLRIAHHVNLTELAGTEVTPDSYYLIVDFAEFTEVYPDLVNPQWAAMSDVQLDEEAARLIAAGPPWLRREQLIARHPEIRTDAHGHVSVVGVRAGLRRWRAAQVERASGLPSATASDYFSGRPSPPELTADMLDDQVQELARASDAQAAHADGVALIGTADYFTHVRAELRAAVRDELSRLGKYTAEMETKARQLTAARTAMVARVLSWRDPAEWDDQRDQPRYAEIGRLANVSRQAANQMYDRITAAEQADPAPA